ncbi:MAG: hypothetical protein HY785_01350 [Oscillatoriophycideae cyanobacterium NC_groundwater_1537_Pr4_S-0.65um_50_18]|nr:hypothetical protein [Oscillatoriophycideae cyanobacterium NC_groundwater_1537_Pr4_S-0.65um_50_18]
MKSFILGAIDRTHTLSKRVFTAMLAVSLVAMAWMSYPNLATASPTVTPKLSLDSANSNYSNDSLGKRMRDRIEETDRNSERPKTTGEFEQEARDGVPLDERVGNIIRDSGEAFKQFGQEYSVGAEESIRSIKDKASDIVH